MAKPVSKEPARGSYDVVIIGGSLMGSSVAWFLASNPDFDGSILVAERDVSFEMTSTAHTTSCIRQQFSTGLNVRISQFAADFINNLPHHLGGDERVPDLSIRSFGYMYLAGDQAQTEALRANLAVQQAEGAATRLLRPDEIAAEYPFYNVDDVVMGSLNTVGEGYFDAGTMFEWLRRKSIERGAEHIASEVVGIERSANGRRVHKVRLAGGHMVTCGEVINCAGPRAAPVAAMAGIDLPVEPRKRYSWVFSAERPLDRELPLTIDPSGIHVRENGGGTYQAGGHETPDPAVAPDDFTMDHDLWQDHVWPLLAHRIPQFEAIRLTHSWAGHYAMNTFDHNAILGRHTDVENFVFLNGFSGHGLQQAPAMGRGIAELLTYGSYQSLDLSEFDYARIPEGRPIAETAII